MSEEHDTTRTGKRRRGSALLLVVLGIATLAGGYAWRTRHISEANDLLFAAISRSDAAGVRYALDHGADPNARRTPEERAGRRLTTRSGVIGIEESPRVKGATALMLAAERSPEICRLLLDRKADVNAAESEEGNWSALMHAVRADSREAAALLIDRGADVDHHDQIGRCSLAIAAGGGRYEMTKLLLDHNAHPNVQDVGGMTPLLAALMRAPEAEGVRCMDILLTHNAIPDQSIHGMSPLIYAIMHDRPDAVPVLLKHRAAVKGIYLGGKAPLAIAREQGNPKVVEMLLKAGAKDEESTKDTKGTKATRSTPKSAVPKP